jgi:hypothetical protein
MTPNQSTGFVTFPEVVMGELTGKFGEISLFNQHADFELESASNSNSTSPWAIACEPAIEPSCANSPLHEHFPYGLCNARKAHAKALTARRANKEIVSDYTSDSNPVSGYYSDSSYEFDFGSDPYEPESEISTTEQPLSGPATVLVITSTPAGRFVSWPDHKHAALTDGNSLLTDKTRIHLQSASVRTYTFFTTGFPRFLSIRGARGLLALNHVLI